MVLLNDARTVAVGFYFSRKVSRILICKCFRNFIFEFLLFPRLNTNLGSFLSPRGGGSTPDQGHHTPLAGAVAGQLSVSQVAALGGYVRMFAALNSLEDPLVADLLATCLGTSRKPPPPAGQPLVTRLT